MTNDQKPSCYSLSFRHQMAAHQSSFVILDSSFLRPFVRNFCAPCAHVENPKSEARWSQNESE